MDTPEARPQFVITLVHGTFARNAPWMNDGSVLRESLTKALAPAKILFVSYHWSGCNSHRARVAGGVSLRRTRRQNLTQYPEAKHVMIAHSHGGNVAVYALNRFAQARKIAGVISLGTPYIEATPNDRRALARRARRSVFMSLLGLTCLVLWSSDRVLAALNFFGPLWHSLVAVPVILWVACVGLFSRRGPFLPRWKRLQAKVASRLACPRQLSVPFLCVSTRRDEARIALKLVAFLDGCLKWLYRAFLVTAVVAFLVVLVGIPVLIYRDVQNKSGLDSLAAIIGGGLLWLVASAVLLLVVVLTVMVGPAFRSVGSGVLRYLGYGSGMRGANSLFLVKQTLVPGSATDTTLHEFASRYSSFVLALRHSDLYLNPEVLAYIARWILLRSNTTSPSKAEKTEKKGG
jgi:hypothetical protein